MALFSQRRAPRTLPLRAGLHPCQQRKKTMAERLASLAQLVEMLRVQLAWQGRAANAKVAKTSEF